MMDTLKKHSTASSLMALSHIACKPSLSGSTATTPSTRITSVCSHRVDDHLLTRPSPQSISLSPIPTDGRIQVQDPCAAETNVITYYDQPTLFSGWSIIADPNHARYMLQLLRFDGALEPRMYLYYKPPMMLPSESSSIDKYCSKSDAGVSQPRNYGRQISSKCIKANTAYLAHYREHQAAAS